MQESHATADFLLRRVARGDAGAVETCIARYAPLVWSLAKRLSRDATALEELVQEIFIAIWKNAGHFDPDKASEATFIAVIARRKVIDRQRRASRAPQVEILEESSASEDESGFAEIEIKDEARRAMEALALLKPEQRKLILMSVVEGRTHQEIASATGLPLGTVKSHIRRGLDKTAQMLRPSAEGGAP